ncbi:MAG: hypothetical protein K2G07_01195 [Muribaculaceae bacterium]|nr:hypothetical protein [Muribaculaceae bacterium]
MIKRLFLLCSIFAAALAAAAQGTGTWNIMPVYGTAADCVIDSPRFVYYLSRGHLFSYDKDNDATTHYSTLNRLNDTGIERIAYNPHSRYLAVVYDSHNIDLLYDNGRVVNMPDIRDANISASKAVNSIEFTPGGRMYVATGFGFVAFDDRNHRVADSGIYNQSFTYATEIDGRVVLMDGTRMYASPVGERHNSFSTFAAVEGKFAGSGASYKRLGDGRLLARNTNTYESACSYFVVEPRLDDMTYTATRIDNGARLMDFAGGADGSVYFAAGTVMRRLLPDGSGSVVAVVPEILRGKVLATHKGPEDVWVADAEGIARYGIEGSTPVQLSAPFRPEALTCHWPAFMHRSADGRRIYVSNSGFDTFKMEPGVENHGFDVVQTTDLLEDGTITDAALKDADGTGLTLTGGTTAIAEDPEHPGRYYISNYQKGIYIIENGEQAGRFDINKLPYSSSWAGYTRDLKFDRRGNLWVGVQAAGSSARNPIYILPAEKRKNPGQVTANDWLAPSVAPYTHGDGSVMLVHSTAPYMVCGANNNGYGLLLYNHNNTETNLADDESHAFQYFSDQDGNNVQVLKVLAIFEDRDGHVWVGYEGGLLMIPDITTAISGGTLNARRPKVARNDGTNYADYLLDGETVIDIDQDPAGRMWFATTGSGAYLTDAAGTTIIDNFNVDNSPLPSNHLLALRCDMAGNAVYIGTEKGLVSYNSTAAPPADDYSDVYAYPNPVRHDYTGWVTITGLMDNSLVKITDAAGNIVAQGTSEGGMYMWDACNLQNQRVRSGVYFVFASQNATGSASGSPATKIMVVN